MSQQQEIIDNQLFETTTEKVIVSPSYGKNRILNDTSIFYKGLFGMILCIVPGAIIGLVLVKISLEQRKIALKSYNSATHYYSILSFDMVKKGRKFAFIGLSVFILEIVTLVTYMSIN